MESAKDGRPSSLPPSRIRGNRVHSSEEHVEVATLLEHTQDVGTVPRPLGENSRFRPDRATAPVAEHDGGGVFPTVRGRARCGRKWRSSPPGRMHAAAQRRVSRARCGESAERREAKDEAARAEQSRAGAPSCTGTARCLCRQLRGTRRLPGLRATAGDTAKVSVDIALAAAATRLRGRPGRPRKAEVRNVSHENCPPTPLE